MSLLGPFQPRAFYNSMKSCQEHMFIDFLGKKKGKTNKHQSGQHSQNFAAATKEQSEEVSLRAASCAK